MAKSRSRRIIITISLIVFCAALLFVCFQLFRVRSVNIIGSAPADYVRSLCGIELGDSIFLVDKQAALEGVEAEPWIKAVNVSIVYPDKVNIEAEQREIAAYVEKEDVLLAIDKECVVLRAEQQKELDMPLITGLKMDVFEVGKTIGLPDKFIIDVIERILKELEGSEIEAAQVDVTFAADIVLVTGEGLKIELGDDTDLRAKLRLAAVTIKELENRGSITGILDVSAVTSAYYREN